MDMARWPMAWQLGVESDRIVDSALHISVSIFSKRIWSGCYSNMDAENIFSIQSG
jgi:hypothetical protein